MTKQLLIALAILVLAIAGAAALIGSRSAPPQRPPDTQAPLVETVAAEFRAGKLGISGAGTVSPRAEVALASEVSGKVVYVNPSLVSGAYVRRGEVLVRVDDSDFQNAVEQAKADVAQQTVSVLQAEEEAALARAEYERFQERETRRSGNVYASIDSNDYAARLVRPDATRGVATADGDANTEDGPGGLVFREPQLRAARASLARSQAALANAELGLSRTVVRAPFSGFVRSKNVAVGSFVSPGMSFAQLVASDVLEVRVPLTREEASLIPNLWSNDSASRSLAAVYTNYGGQRYKWDAYIDRAEAILDPATRTINAVLRVPSPVSGGQLVADATGAASESTSIIQTQAPPLLVGEFVEVEIDGAELDRYLIIPRRALRADETIWVVRNGEIDIVPVEVLQEADARAFVLTDEIESGDQVVISDMTVVTQGMKVRVAANA